MRVDVIEGKAGRLERLELRGDLRRQLRADAWLEEEPEPRTELIGWEPALAVDQIGDLIGGRTGVPSTSTMCRPTPSAGSRFATATASATACSPTIKLAQVSTPSRQAASTALLTSTVRPKSSAQTITRFTATRPCSAVP